MSLKLKTASNGSVTLSPQGTVSDVVVTVPAVAATLNTPGAANEVPADGAELQDATGETMSVEQVAEFMETLP